MLSYLEAPEAFVDYRYQWVIYKGDLPQAPGWIVSHCGEWSVARHQDLPFVELVAGDSTPVGWFLGIPILDGAVLRDSYTLPVASPNDVTAELIEKVLYDISGRYLCFVNAPFCSRLYLDPFGSLAAVYSKSMPLIAATTTLIGTEKLKYGSFPAEHPCQFFPAGLTHDLRIRRVLPNHFLDLERWCVFRHWPQGAFSCLLNEPMKELAGWLAGLIAKNIKALSYLQPLYLGLTGGNDSRMLLACSRSTGIPIRCVTFDYGNRTRRNLIDVRLSSLISRLGGLEHIILRVPDVDRREEEAYWERIGFSGGYGKSRDYGKALRQLNRGGCFLIGYGGDLVRGGWSAPTGYRCWDHERPQPETLLHRIELPSRPDFVNALQEWLLNLPPMTSAHIFDLSHWEHRLGGWASPHLYGASLFIVSPFCDRRFLSQAIALPLEYRKMHLAHDIIGSFWPEITDLPANDFFGWRKVLDRLLRAIRSPKLIISAVSKRVNRVLKRSRRPAI